MTGNTALLLCYDGTAYHGWQTQKNGVSVQQTIERALEKSLGRRVRLSGVGRTDAGVHARRYVANFLGPCAIPLARLPLALNSRLPTDIAILAAAAVPDGFDARFDCRRKEYTYLIARQKMRDPFLVHRAYHHPYPLDVGRMQQAAGHLIGRHDFAALRSTGTPVSSTVRTVFDCRVEEEGARLRIRVSADGFLYHMVRGIAGTLLYVGQGKLAPADIPALLEGGRRADSGPNLPACGLYMTRLWYDTPALQALQLDQ